MWNSCCNNWIVHRYLKPSNILFVILFLSGWGLLFFGGYKFYTRGKDKGKDSRLDRGLKRAGVILSNRGNLLLNLLSLIFCSILKSFAYLFLGLVAFYDDFDMFKDPQESIFLRELYFD